MMGEIMYNIQPPSYKTYFMDLPLSRLHVMEAGTGAPLIIVPATISELENWRSLAQFMAQWFRVYFFELPGHGQSEPFKENFSSHQVAELVKQLVDAIGYDHFSLMGFSFGGILAMRTFKLLTPRIDRLILIAPCLGQRALSLSSLRLKLLLKFNRLLSRPKAQARFVRLIHNDRTISMMVKTIQTFGKLEDTIPLKKKLPRTQAATISVLNAQINEILTTEFEVEPAKHKVPCYFAMSIYDPLLYFETTLEILQNHFEEVDTVRLKYPFHQPPAPFTYDELNRDFYQTVDAFVQSKT